MIRKVTKQRQEEQLLEWPESFYGVKDPEKKEGSSYSPHRRGKRAGGEPASDGTLGEKIRRKGKEFRRD